MLRNLKAQFEPTDQAQKNEILADWLNAIKRPKGRTDREKWLKDLELAYDRAYQIDLSEVKGLRPHFALTNAVAEIAPQFAASWDLNLVSLTDKNAMTYLFKDIIR